MMKTDKALTKVPTPHDKALNHRYTAAMVNYICDKIEDGNTIKDICEKFSEYVPTEKQIYRWKAKYPDFKQALNDAYQTLFYKMIDELDYLSKRELELQKFLRDNPVDVNAKEQYFLAKMRQEATKTRIDALKYILQRLAPKLVDDLKDTPKQQLPPLVLPNIQIINYGDKGNDNTK